MKRKLIHISLSPNLEKDDFLLAKSLLKSPARWLKGGSLKALEKEFKTLYPNSLVLFFDSGRSALYFLLKNLELQNQKIALQAFTCLVVPNSIKWAGALPYYLDIDESLNLDPENLKAKLKENFKVVIVQHTFGIPAQLDKIIQLTEENNLFLIEDCAHSLGAKYQNKLVGGFGEASIFSFGRGKVISSVSGGALILNNPSLFDKFISAYQKLNYPPKSWVFKILLHPIITWFVKNHYNFNGKVLLEISKLIKLFPLELTEKEKKGEQPLNFCYKMPNAIALLALNQVRKLDKFNKHRQEIAKIYKSSLVLSPQKINENSDPIFLRYYLQREHPERIIELAKKENIILGDWYNSVIAPVQKRLDRWGYHYGMCPKAEILALQSLNLPTNISTTKEDALRIVEFLQKFKKL